MLMSLLRVPSVQLLAVSLLLGSIHVSFSSLGDISDGKYSHKVATPPSLYPAKKSCEAGFGSKCSERSHSRYFESSSINEKIGRVL